MIEGDKKLATPGDVTTAFALLTRLPLPTTAPMGRSAAAAWAYPLVGCGLGLIAGIAGALGLWLGLTPTLAAGLSLATLVITSGAMHEDGLADAADGLWGGWDKARRLEIMHDSRIGSYGVLAIGLSLFLRATALAVLFAAGHVFAPLIVVGALSRATLAPMMVLLPHARQDGLSVATGRPGATTAWLGIAVALGLALTLTGGAGIVAAIVASLAAFGMAMIARAKLGGQTGDILGATQQLSEIAALLSFAALFA